MKCWRMKEDNSLCENEGTLTTTNGYPVCEQCKNKINEYVGPQNIIAIQQAGNAFLKKK